MLDIGGWGDPFERSDWVIDIAPFDTRGFYERAGWKEPGPRLPVLPEHFTKESWIERDICDREPYPFRDGEIDFVICSQTLEDVRDPLWVCSEINRIAKAGYIEVPSRLEEQSWGVDGTLVGRHHHHWLIDMNESGLDFVFKRHDIHTRPEFYFPPGFWAALTAEERIQRLWWKNRSPTVSGFCSSRREQMRMTTLLVSCLASVPRGTRASPDRGRCWIGIKSAPCFAPDGIPICSDHSGSRGARRLSPLEE